MLRAVQAHIHNGVNDQKLQGIVIEGALKLGDDQAPETQLPTRDGTRRPIRGEGAGSLAGLGFAPIHGRKGLKRLRAAVLPPAAQEENVAASEQGISCKIDTA